MDDASYHRFNDLVEWSTWRRAQVVLARAPGAFIRQTWKLSAEAMVTHSR
jgi:hypothetical protein